MKIYFTPFSPYVRKCLLVAHELGLHEHLELLCANPNPIDRDQVVMQSNPLGKVPTFIADDGMILYDSRVICEYLDNLADGQIFPKDGPARWTALTLQSLGDGMADGAFLARVEDTMRPEPLRWPAWRSAQLDKSLSSLKYLESNMGLFTDGVNIGSIAVASALWYLDLRFPDFNWRQEHSSVAGWFEAFRQRPSMQANWTV